MPIIMSDNRSWLEWMEVQKRAAKALAEADYDSATAIVNRFLGKTTFTDLRSDALAFRASLNEDRGALKAARQDLAEALELVDVGYQQYSLELSLGRLDEEHASDLKGARRWYLRAIETAIEDGKTSAGTALLRFLAARGEQNLLPEERQLVEESMRKSWHLLKLKGEPDLDRLERMAQLLVEAQGKPLSD
jgi:hypothetical protein